MGKLEKSKWSNLIQIYRMMFKYWFHMVILVLILLKNLCYFAPRMFFVNLLDKTIGDVRNYMFERYPSQSFGVFQSGSGR